MSLRYLFVSHIAMNRYFYLYISVLHVTGMCFTYATSALPSNTGSDSPALSLAFFELFIVTNN